MRKGQEAKLYSSFDCLMSESGSKMKVYIGVDEHSMYIVVDEHIHSPFSPNPPCSPYVEGATSKVLK